MYEVSYNGRTPYVSNYSTVTHDRKDRYYDAERDLLAIAKFLVRIKLRCIYQLLPV